MKNVIYILAVIVFFNLSIFCLYYLKLIENLSVFVFLNNTYDLLIVNVLLGSILLIYTLVYKCFFLDKFKYFFTAVVGLVIGVLLSLLFNKEWSVEMVFMSLFISFSITYISYSIYFDSVKKEVFK